MSNDKTEALEVVAGTGMAPSGAPDMTQLMQLAIQQPDGQGVEALERLVALQERIDDRNAAAEFGRALAKAKAAFPVIEKTYKGVHTARVGTVTRGNYAPLHQITKAIDPVLSDNGFTYGWDRVKVDGEPMMRCTLSHAAGHRRSADFPTIKDTGGKKSDIQAIASGSTYAMRYSLVQVLGLTMCDPDTDAAPPPDTRRISEDQAMTIASMLEEPDIKANTDLTKFLAYFKADSAEKLLAADFDRAVVMLERKRS